MLILILSIIIALVVIFFPKHCGNWGTAIHPDTKYQDCTCFGIKTSGYPLKGITIGGDYLYCWGISTSYSCYKRTFNETGGIEEIDIPCE